MREGVCGGVQMEMVCVWCILALLLPPLPRASSSLPHVVKKLL